MARRRMETMEVRELLRRMRAGESDRQIARSMGVNRKTVGKYRRWAREQELVGGAVPPAAELERLLAARWPEQRPPQQISSVEPYRAAVVQLREQGVELAAIHQRLQEEHGYTGSYTAVWRFVHRLEPARPDVTVRVEVPPGEEAQVDFGSAGLMIEPATGKLRRAWVFVMTLSWSRHQYVEVVFDQTVTTWLLLHRHAFESFAGVPARVVLDNLKAGIVRACWHEPEAQRAYRECAEHYGFLIAPCRPATPEHKGKVEQGGVHYVKRNFLAGRAPLPLPELNRKVQHWALEVAGQRVHGTTRARPLERFVRVEQAALQPLPPTPYTPATWKRVRLHRDCYVVFGQAYYSAPFRLVGQELWVRGTATAVRLYTAGHELVALHSPGAPGERQTVLDHLPPEKVPGLLLSRPLCQAQAAAIGPATAAVVQQLLDHRPEDRLRAAGRLLRLTERFGSARLEAACARALAYDTASYLSVRRILEAELDQQSVPAPPPAAPARTFVRSAREFARSVLGGVTWN